MAQSGTTDLGANIGNGGGGGGGVTSLNGLTGALALIGGTGITITPSGNNIIISSSDLMNAITSINGDTTTAQTLSVGTAGTDFAIVDAGGGSHVFNLPTASATNRGALSSADWSTFNAKQPAGAYITALTGDGTATGPGSVPFTLATVNSNVGSFGSSTAIPTITVNAKGLTTAVSTNAVIAPAGTLTGTTLASNVVSSSLTSVGTITSGVWNGTTIAIANGGTGQTTASSAFNALSPITSTGDLILGTGINTAGRLGIGSTGQILTVSGGTAVWSAPATSGTVTSVALSLPASVFAVTGSPVTSSGTLTGSFNTQSANTVFAGPTTGAATVPAFRLLVSADIPNNAANTTGTASNITATSNSTLTTLTALMLPTSQLTGTISLTTQVSGVLPIANGGTSQTTAAAARGPSGLNIDERTTVNNTNYSILATDRYVAQTGTMTASRTFTLPTASSVNPGQLLVIDDESGTVTTTNTIVIAPNGADTINKSASSSTIRTGFGRALLFSDGISNWTDTVTGVSRGGTGLTALPADGQLLIGQTSTGTYVLNTLTAGTGINVVNAGGSITISSSNTAAQTTKTTNYTITTADSTIFCDTSGAAFTLTLPNPSGIAGKMYRVIDIKGTFDSNNLTLARFSAEKIEGIAASKVLQTAWGWFQITTDGTDWYVG